MYVEMVTLGWPRGGRRRRHCRRLGKKPLQSCLCTARCLGRCELCWAPYRWEQRRWTRTQWPGDVVPKPSTHPHSKGGRVRVQMRVGVNDVFCFMIYWVCIGVGALSYCGFVLRLGRCLIIGFLFNCSLEFYSFIFDEWLYSFQVGPLEH